MWVQWINEVLCLYQVLVQLDSLVIRYSILRQAEYAQKDEISKAHQLFSHIWGAGKKKNI